MNFSKGGETMPTKPKAISQTTKHMTKAERDAREQVEAKFKNALAEIEPPQWLTEAQQRKFNFYVEQMAELDILKNLDANHLSRYVCFEERYIEINKMIAEQPYTVNGKINPLLVEQRQIHGVMEKLETKLGMNPSDRLRFMKPQGEMVDELEAFKNEL